MRGWMNIFQPFYRYVLFFLVCFSFYSIDMPLYAQDRAKLVFPVDSFVLADSSSSDSLKHDKLGTTTANDTLENDSVSSYLKIDILKTISKVIPDSVVGVSTYYVPQKIFETLESIAKDTFAIDTSTAFHYRTLALARRIYRYLYLTVEKTSSVGVTTISDPERIMKLRDYFTEAGRKSGWHPLIDFTSGTRVKGGAKFFYRSGGSGYVLRALYTEKRKWLAKGYYTHQWVVNKDVHQIALTLEKRMDDDMFFYGIGPDPLTDTKSNFKSTTGRDRGLFHQDITKLQMIMGVRSSPVLSYRLSFIVQERRILEPPLEEEEKFDDVFNVNLLSGGTSRGRLAYNEFAVNYDSRSLYEGISKGLMAEGYLGLAGGLGKADKSSFLRYGFELVKSIPAFGHKRQIVPKFTANMVENLNSNSHIKFYDYPRHPSFRGVSPRYVLRSDKMVWVSTMEIHQPLIKRLMGKAFFDYLTVGPTLDEMGWDKGMWVAGIKISYHNRYSELGSVLLAYGPEGVRVGATLGVQKNRNERSHWR